MSVPSELPMPHDESAQMARTVQQTLILLHSNAALPAALSDLERALASGSKVTLFVFNPRMARFLEPLKKQGVKVVPCEHNIEVRVYRFWTWLPQTMRFRRWLALTFDRCAHCTVRFYNDGFDIPLMGSIAYLARRRSRLIFEDWDHTRATGLDKHEATSLFLKSFGLLASIISGASLVMLNPEAPFPCLRPEFYTRYKVECAPRRNLAHLQLADLTVARELMTATNASIVWLWDDLSAFYGEALVPRENFLALYDQLYAIACKLVPSGAQAVKPHPSLDGKDVPVCKGADLLPARVPVEFVKFTAKPVAITVSSYASKVFVDRGRPVISLLRMIKAGPAVIQEAERAINDWLKARNDIFFPASADEFSHILQGILNES